MIENAHIPSYPSVYAIGHAAIVDIFAGSVIVQEKIDGSQFSFARVGGELLCRSKNQQIASTETKGMFAPAVNAVRERVRRLEEGAIYRCEFVSTPKHNTLNYARVPAGLLVLFDIEVGTQRFMAAPEVQREAERLGLEPVPVLHEGMVTSFDDLRILLDRESGLGGPTVEGVVVKNYAKFTAGEKKVMLGKYVAEAFKEVHKTDWRKHNPTRTDRVEAVIAAYATEARWQKSVQHLRERGELEGSPRDIGKLIEEVPADVLKECEEEIKAIMFKHFWRDIRRGVTRGLPEWYKAELAKSAFKIEP